MGTPETTHTTVNVIDGSLDTNGKSLLLKATLTQLIEHGELKFMPTQSLHLQGLVFLELESSLHATKGEM